MIALSTASLYQYNIEKVFELAKDTGFEGIELNIDNRAETRNKELLSNIEKVYQLPIISIHTPCNFRHRRLWGRGIPIKIDKTVEIAKSLGVSIVVTHIPLLWQFDYIRWLSLNLPTYEIENIIVIAIENIGLTPILWFRFNLHRYNRLDALSKFPNLAFDTSHCGSLKIDICEAYKLLHYKIRHIHLSNYRNNGVEHCLLTEGDLPIKDFLQSLSDNEYQGAIVLEFSPRSLGYPDFQKIKSNLSENVKFCLDNLR